MKNNNTNDKKTSTIIFIIIMALFILGCMIFYGYVLHTKSVKGVDISSGWTFVANGEEVSNYELKSGERLSDGKICTISRKLPMDFEQGDSLYFQTQSVAVRIYIDDEEIYEYGYDQDRINRSPGDFVHFVKLPEDAEGKNVIFEIYFPYQSASFMIKQVKIVDDESAAIADIRSKMIPTLVCLFVFFLSVICILCEMVLFRRIFGNTCLVYISMFLLCLSAWSLTQVQIVPIIYGGKYYHSAMAYILLSFLPFLLVKYVLERFSLKDFVLSKVMVGITIVNLIIIHVLNITGIWEYTDSLILTHIALVGSAAFLIATSIKHRESIASISVRKLLPISVLFLVICGILDVVNSYICIVSDFSFFSRFGILVLSLSVFIDVIDSSLHMVMLGEDSAINQVRAHTDALTGMENRMSLDEAVSELHSKNQKEIEYGFMVFDINDLKKVNDSLGHEAGDRLIIKGARLISHSSMTMGRVFRYGGDEFVVLITENVEENINSIIRNFEKHIKDVNDNNEIGLPINIAYGYAIHKKDSAETVEEIIQIADNNMYDCKLKMKSKMY